PGTVHKLAQAGQGKKVKVIDAPVSGGEAGARERQLCYMVGGETEVFEKVRPVLAASAAHVFHMGALGSGAAAKMILQVAVCINMLGAYEAEILADKCGLDFKVLQEVLRVSSGQSFVVDHWLERFKRPDDPLNVRHRRTEVFSESLSPALLTARELDISLPGAALVQQLLRRIMGVDDSGERSTYGMQRGGSVEFDWRMFFVSLLLMVVHISSVEAARVRVGIRSPTHAVLPFPTSREKGYYRDEGLEVELILMSARIASRALLSGDVEVATVGGAGLPPVLNGAPLRFVFTTYNRPMFWLFGKSEIPAVKELKGKKVGVSGIGIGPD